MSNEILKGLNKVQTKAVQDTDGFTLTLAGAGSGKTRILTCRIAYLIKQKNVSPWNILAVTFTNKAAREMKERIISLVGEEAKHIWAGTFHSICVRLISMFGEDIGIAKNFTILDEAEKDKILKECYTRIYEKPEKDQLENLKYMLGLWKNGLITPEEAIEQTQPGTDKAMHNRAANVYLEYQHILKASNSLDFDDLIMKTVFLCNHSEKARAYIDKKFRYMLVN